MDISGVGGIGMSGLAGSAALGGAAVVSGLAASQASVGATAMPGVAFGRMDQLIQLLGDFSTSEILLALMLAQAKKPEQRSQTAVASSLGRCRKRTVVCDVGRITPRPSLRASRLDGRDRSARHRSPRRADQRAVLTRTIVLTSRA